MLTMKSFLADIDSYLNRTGMAESAFGRAAVGDPNFVSDCREGREPGLRLIRRVTEFMARRRKKQAPERTLGDAR